MGIRLAINEKESEATVNQLVEIITNLGSGMYSDSIIYMLMNHPDTVEIIGKKIMAGQVNVRQEGTSEEPVIQSHQSRL